MELETITSNDLTDTQYKLRNYNVETYMLKQLCKGLTSHLSYSPLYDESEIHD